MIILRLIVVETGLSFERINQTMNFDVRTFHYRKIIYIIWYVQQITKSTVHMSTNIDQSQFRNRARNCQKIEMVSVRQLFYNIVNFVNEAAITTPPLWNMWQLLIQIQTIDVVMETNLGISECFSSVKIHNCRLYYLSGWNRKLIDYKTQHVVQHQHAVRCMIAAQSATTLQNHGCPVGSCTGVVCGCDSEHCWLSVCRLWTSPDSLGLHLVSTIVFNLVYLIMYCNSILFSNKLTSNCYLFFMIQTVWHYIAYTELKCR